MADQTRSRADEARGADDGGITLTALFEGIWRGRWIITACVVAALAIAGVAYFFVPRTFETTVDVYPLRQADYAPYLSLNQSNAFPYTPKDLENEFVSYLRDTEMLAQFAISTGVVPRNNMTDEVYDQAVADFLDSMSFRFVVVNGQTDATNLKVTARGPSRLTLADFIGKVFTAATQNMSLGMAAEIKDRAQSLRDTQEGLASGVAVKIDAAKAQADAERKDEAARLTEDAKVATAVGLEKPVVVSALPGGGTTPGAPILSVGTPQNYLQGSLALDEQIQLLASRQDNGPYVTDLRKLENDYYVAKNDPQADRILSLLARTPLAAPEKAKLVRFSLVALPVDQVFPRFAVFAALGLLGGLVVGVLIAIGWAFLAGPRTSRRAST